MSAVLFPAYLVCTLVGFKMQSLVMKITQSFLEFEELKENVNIVLE